MPRVARLAPYPRSHVFAVSLAGAGLVLAIGFALVLPAALAFSGL